MKYLGVLISTLLLTCVAGGPTDCRKTYSNLLQEVISMKTKCIGAGFRDCCQVEALVPLAKTGSYEVLDVCDSPATTFGSTQLYARCDMESDGGKWMVIQRRINGSVDFYRNWTDYVYGFGDLEGEFWYGLEKIHCLTTREDVELRIELGNGTEPSIVWTYQLFRVGGADTNYRLTVGQGKGVGGTTDGMIHHNGRSFSTPDRDHDESGSSCAIIYGGAWWYGSCYTANLNGRYGWHNNAGYRQSWVERGQNIHYTNVQMKIRPKYCSDTC